MLAHACMYMCVYISTCGHECVCIRVCVYVCTSTSEDVHVCVHISTCGDDHVCMCVFQPMRMCVSVSTYKNACVCENM